MTTDEQQQKRARQRKNRWRRFKFDLLRRLFVPLLVPILKLLVRTWRYRISDMEAYAEMANPKRPIVLAVMHGHALCILGGTYRRFNGQQIVSHTMVSPSRDGEVLTDVLLRFGQKTVTGSSKRRGVAALLELRKVLATNAVAVIACDGPRGPRGVPQGGVIALARTTNARMYLLACSARPAFRFNSWDRLLLPLPFARVDIKVRHYRDYEAGEPAAEIDTERATIQRLMVGDLQQFGEPTDDIQMLDETKND